MRSFVERRAAMVAGQLVRRGITDPRVLAAMGEVPREAFVPEAQHPFAYDDRPLPIEAGQTISQPYIVALMAEAATLSPDDRVIEVGAGSGYAAAVLGRIAGQVFAIERHVELARLAAGRMIRLGYGNVSIREGDGTLGLPEEALFDAIVVAAGGPDVPAALLDQLAIGGRLVMPVGRGWSQRLVRVRRETASGYAEDDLGEVMFVPLVGAQGWPEN